MPDVYEESVALHREQKGKLKIESTVPVENRSDLSLAYTPGVAEPCRRIAADEAESFDLTWRGRVVAVVSDGSAVLGLGNIGAAAALPVMEGKALLMKRFGGFDAVPLVVDAHTPAELITFVRQIAPGFGGINLEDIAAPVCFEVEDALQDLDITVFHDDQHGTAIVVLAAILNAAKVVGKHFTDLTVCVLGAGAAGVAVTQLLAGLDRIDGDFVPVDGVPHVKEVRIVDSKGLLSVGREGMNPYKDRLVAKLPNTATGETLTDALTGADVFIGVAGPNLVTAEMIKNMADQAIVLAMANPTPEIMPDEAKAGGAAVVATGRSDFPNQVNNVLVFPGVFKSCLEGRIKRVTYPMRWAAAEAVAALVSQPTAENIIPGAFDADVAEAVSQAIKKK